jgi:hypothetical protein
MMEESEGGKKYTLGFELWFIEGGVGPGQTLTITAVSFAESGDHTLVDIWHHRARVVKTIKPGVFSAPMNGRWSRCSGLDVMLRVEQDRITDITGTIRTGANCDAVRVYRPDKTSDDRTVPPISNPRGR